MPRASIALFNRGVGPGVRGVQFLRGRSRGDGFELCERTIRISETVSCAREQTTRPLLSGGIIPDSPSSSKG